MEPYQGSWVPELARVHADGMTQLREMYDEHVAKLTVAWDLAKNPSVTSYAKVSLVDGTLVYTPISAAEFYAENEPD